MSKNDNTNCSYQYDYEDKCDCSEDDKCGCTYPNNMPHDVKCTSSKNKKDIQPGAENPSK